MNFSYSKNYVLYKVIKNLTGIVDDNTIDQWCKALSAVCIIKRKLILYIADDSLRNDFVENYTLLVDKVLQTLFKNDVCEVVVFPQTIEVLADPPDSNGG